MSGRQLFVQFALPAAGVFILLGSLLGVVVGIGLIVRSPSTMRFMQAMNRWVSMPGGAVTALEGPCRCPRRHRAAAGSAPC